SERAGDDEVRLLDPAPDGEMDRQTAMLGLDATAAYADDTGADVGAGITGAVLTVGHHRQGEALPAAIDVEPQRLTGTRRDDLLHFLEVVDLPAINGNDHVAGLEPGA